MLRTHPCGISAGKISSQASTKELDLLGLIKKYIENALEVTVSSRANILFNRMRCTMRDVEFCSAHAPSVTNALAALVALARS